MCEQANRKQTRDAAGDIRAQAITYADDAVRTVAAIMGSDKATNGDRIRAALAIIDRACGKAEETIRERPSRQTLREIDAELQKLMKAQP